MPRDHIGGVSNQYTSLEWLSESGTEVSDRMQDWILYLGNIKNEVGKTDLNKNENPGIIGILRVR